MTSTLPAVDVTVYRDQDRVVVVQGESDETYLTWEQARDLAQTLLMFARDARATPFDESTIGRVVVAHDPTARET